MIPNLQGHAKTPQYLRLADELRQQIASGSLQPGDRLPTFAEARAVYGANAYTVERAQALLEQEGLISRARGRGALVLQPAAKPQTGLIGLCGADFTRSLY